jgi:hypothetical protein
MTTLLAFQRHSSTSRRAALSMHTQAASYREQVLHAIRLLGPCTDEQIIDATSLNPSTARPRRIELLRDGLIRQAQVDGRTRSGRLAHRWEIVPTGPVQGELL